MIPKKTKKQKTTKNQRSKTMRIYGPDKKFFSPGLPQAKRCKNIEVFHTPQDTHGVWKIAKNQSHLVKFGCGSPGLLVNFLAGQENHPTFNIYGQL